MRLMATFSWLSGFGWRDLMGSRGCWWWWIWKPEIRLRLEVVFILAERGPAGRLAQGQGRWGLGRGESLTTRRFTSTNMSPVQEATTLCIISEACTTGFSEVSDLSAGVRYTMWENVSIAKTNRARETPSPVCIIKIQWKFKSFCLLVLVSFIPKRRTGLHLAGSGGAIECVAVRLRNGVAVRATVLSVVGGVRRSPGLVVKRAVNTLGNVVLGQNVDVEEFASGVAAISVRVLLVILSLRSACLGALVSLETVHVVEGEVFVAKVGVVTIWVERSIDGATEFLGTSVAGLRWWGTILVVCFEDSQDGTEKGAGC